MKPNHLVISHQDMLHASINNQETYQGAGPLDLSDMDDKVFFIVAVQGTAVTIKDADDNTVAILTDKTTMFPLRFDGGFKASSAGTFTLIYFSVPNIA